MHFKRGVILKLNLEYRYLRILRSVFLLFIILTFAFSGNVKCFADNKNQKKTNPVQLYVDANTEDEYLMTFDKVSETSDAVLYADKKRGHIALENKQSGKIWYSVPNDFLNDQITFGDKRSEVYSDITVGYLNAQDENTAVDIKIANSHNECVLNDGIKTSDIENGVSIAYDFKSIGVYIPVKYVLTENGFEATIELKKIKCSKDVILVNIALLPSFGAGNSSAQGYLFIPDGCGALVNYNNQVVTESGYHSYVYGKELAVEQRESKNVEESVKMPVFGLKENDDALFAIIVSGDAMASINAENGNSEMGYNRAWSQAEQRIVSNTLLYEDDWANRSIITKASRNLPQNKYYTVRYMMLSGEKADYVGMAEAYRNYLISKGLKKHDTSSAMALSLYGAADKEAYFIGIPYTKTLPLTTFAQAQEILNQLKELGIDNISARYVGWTNGGILNSKLPKNANALKQLGGDKSLNNLKEYCEENSFGLSLDLDILRFRKSGNGFSKSQDAAKTVFGSVAKRHKYLRSVYSEKSAEYDYRLIKPSELSDLSNKLLKKIDSKNIKSISLSVLGSNIYSDFDEKDGTYRSETVKIYEELLKNYSDKNIALSFDSANSYTFPYAEQIFSVPAFSGGYGMFDCDVPFYQILLHGYIDIFSESLSSTSEKEQLFLKAAETGVNLHFDGMYSDASVLSNSKYDDLYSTTFDLWKDEAAKYYKALSPLLEAVKGSVITEHSVNGDYTKTVFDNGVCVYVNYGNTDINVDGLSLKGRSFVFK